MKPSPKEILLRKSKRMLSDFQPKQTQFKNMDELYEDSKFERLKPNTIKINKNKLPPDFFPHTQSMRKKFTYNRPSLPDEKDKFGQRKAESEKNILSPEKTSFFGFFQQKQKTKRNAGNSLSIKRHFESRDEPKRQKMFQEHRNNTALASSQKSQFLEMFPTSHDQMTFNAIINSKKIKGLATSAIKQQQNSLKQDFFLREDPEKFVQKRQNFKQIANISSPDNIHNITFFNIRSTSFPPIFKTNSVS